MAAKVNQSGTYYRSKADLLLKARLLHLRSAMDKREKEISAEPVSPDEDGCAMSESSFSLAIASIKINDASPIPLYEQICYFIRTAIVSGELPPGTHLPKSRELADALNIGRNTVVHAYSRLVAEGYLFANKRRGTRVANDALVMPHALRDERNRESGQELQTSEQKGNFDGCKTTSSLDISYRARQFLSGRTPTNVVMPFALNVPDFSLYPRNPLSRLLAEEFSRTPSGSDLRHNLRKFQAAMCKHLRHMRGVNCEPAQIIPITGLESALDLTTRVMLDPGHWAYVEDPTNDVVLQCLRSARAQLVPIPSDGNGADISRASGPPPRLIFSSPSVSFPYGRQLSETRRDAILAFARHWNAVIFECDALWELTYTGIRVRAMQGIDRDARVIYFGNLNQTLGPHIRVGYLVVPPALVDSFTEMAQRVSYGPDEFVLAALATFVQDTDYVVHTKLLRSVYAERLRVLVQAIRSQIGDITILEPSGGLHLTVLLNDMLDEDAVCRAATDKGLSVAPLSRFRVGADRSPNVSGITLGFGSVPDRIIETMVRRLADAITEVRGTAQSPALVA